MPKRVVIIGASGRDFHNFNVYFRDNPEYRVVAFLQTQIKGLKTRVYPPELAGKLYPNGIPVLGMGYLEELAK
ncbi:MAG: GTPase, partial [Thermogladius sp.]